MATHQAYFPSRRTTRSRNARKEDFLAMETRRQETSLLVPGVSVQESEGAEYND
jgi:hypothetical protein